MFDLTVEFFENDISELISIDWLVNMTIEINFSLLVNKPEKKIWKWRFGWLVNPKQFLIWLTSNKAKYQ